MALFMARNSIKFIRQGPKAIKNTDNSAVKIRRFFMIKRYNTK